MYGIGVLMIICWLMVWLTHDQLKRSDAHE
jgi:hypothetical protein